MLRTIVLWDRSFGGDIGQVLSASDEKAADLVSSGDAVYVDGVEPVREIPNTEQPDPVSEVLPSKTEEAEKLKRPYGNATKDEWRKYALATDPDLTEEAAADMSKVQLMQAYGERL